MLLLATRTTIMDLLATSAQLEPGEQVLLLSTGGTRSRGIATPLMVLKALAITKPCTTESAFFWQHPRNHSSRTPLLLFLLQSFIALCYLEVVYYHRLLLTFILYE